LFMGRGQHPFRGKWKPRVSQSDVVLNLGEEATVPPGSWKEIVHDHNSMWMAKWVDKLTQKEKYVWLHESSPIQQSRSKAKYDNARRVGANLQKIRARVLKELDTRDERSRQVATVCYLIDTLGMRVGDEKDEDEADTVGASTLRVEHVGLKGNLAEFNFLGKDSVAAESELYYRLDGALHYGTIESLFQGVRSKKTWRDSSGREVIIPRGRVEVLTVNDLVQKRARIVWTDVKQLFSHYVEGPLFQINAAAGHSVRITGDHSIFCGLNQYRATCLPTIELTTDSSLVCVTSLPISSTEVTSLNGVKITKDLMTFLGLWFADGCKYDKGIVIAGGGDEAVEAFLSRFSESYQPFMRQQIETEIVSSSIEGNNYSRARLSTVLKRVDEVGFSFGISIAKNGDIWCHSVTLLHMLERLEISGNSHTKTIPEWIMCLSDGLVECFLRGYFSGDGFADSRRGNPTCSSVNAHLSNQIRTLLLRLGIDSTLDASSGGGYQHASVSFVVRVGRSDGRNVFERRIGFIEDAKQSNLRHSTPRYKTYGFRWRKVKGVSPAGRRETVYDLSTENERFIVNNLLVHNSVAWHKSEELPSSVARNLREFTSGKNPEDEIFHNVTSSMVNQFLSSVVPGATAKVFRTFHATAKAKEALGSRDMREADDLDKLYHAKEANLQAAVFCNHQRTPPKTWEQSLEKKKLKLQAAQASGDENRTAKLEREVDFYVRTKNYNLNTSMKNYIDPRVVKAWCDHVGLDWAKVYSKSLQKKFSWVLQSSAKWESEQAPELRPVPTARRASERSP